MRMLKIVNPGTAFHVSYRIAGKRTSQGATKDRYDGLIERLRKLKATLRSAHFEDEAHTATSSWIVRSKEASAATLTAKLAKGLTAGVDLLEVIEVNIDNWQMLTK